MEEVKVIEHYYLPRTINILGTKYEFKILWVSEAYDTDADAKKLADNGLAGYHDGYEKKIVISSLDDYKYHPQFANASFNCKLQSIKEIIRHEIVHAFLDESGLKQETDSKDIPWQRNEVCVDWIAIQSPKMFKVFKECNLLD